MNTVKIFCLLWLNAYLYISLMWLISCIPQWTTNAKLWGEVLSGTDSHDLGGLQGEGTRVLWSVLWPVALGSLEEWWGKRGAPGPRGITVGLGGSWPYHKGQFGISEDNWFQDLFDLKIAYFLYLYFHHKNIQSCNSYQVFLKFFEEGYLYLKNSAFKKYDCHSMDVSPTPQKTITTTTKKPTKETFKQKSLQQQLPHEIIILSFIHWHWV